MSKPTRPKPLASSKIWSVVAAALVAGLPESTAAQTLFFSAFDEDDTSYFEVSFGPPDTLASFDSALGSPAPGSLRLSRTTSSSSAQLISPCLPFVEERRYTIAADARAEVIGAGCSVGFVLHDDLACGDNPAISTNPSLGTQTVELWEPIEASVAGEEVSQAYRRVRFTLNLLPAAAPAACNFDNVRISSQQVESIPAAGPWGYLLLLAGAVGVGLWTLRRRV
jgi:hypothetical protein